MWWLSQQKLEIPSADRALPGRAEAMPVPETHFVNGRQMLPPYPEGMEIAMFGMGCFWGVERIFWQAPGVFVTAAGYAGGHTPNPMYEEVCSGLTGHNEVVQVVFDPLETSYEAMLKLFWEGHDPTQGMRQGNDVGTQYRSEIYVYSEEQRALAESTKGVYEEILAKGRFDAITTEIVEALPFYFAEHYHQQYLAKNPNGYCGLGGTGLACGIEPPARVAVDNS
jgi:peptide-methionine (S)-S-oxide reductase